MAYMLQTSEFAEWHAALRDRTAATQIASRIRRMATGNIGDVKTVGKGVVEARIHSGPGYRLYVHVVGEMLIVLLCGGDKGSQVRDIARAITLVEEMTQWN